MDNLVLIRVVAALRRSLEGAVLRELRGEPGHRLRLLLLRAEKPRTVLVSLDPARPWMGRPATRAPKAEKSPEPFFAACRRRLRGVVLTGIDKPPADRRVTFRFADGHRLVAELIPAAANLILLDGEGKVLAVARRPRRTRERYAPGKPYRAPPLPDRLDPFGLTADVIDAHLRQAATQGGSDPSALGKGCVGLSREAVRLVAEESRQRGLSIGCVLAKRLDALLQGTLNPVIVSADRPLEAAERGELDPAGCRLLPWEPADSPPPPLRRFVMDDAARTAGLFHEAIDLALSQRLRARSLLTALDKQIARVGQAESQAAADLQRFEQPERFRRWAESLLAGLRDVHRVGDHVLVTDPYAADESKIPIPVAPGKSAQQAAQEYFELHRRALRGLARARRRAAGLAERRKCLEGLRTAHAGLTDKGTTAELERALQEQGIPVGLEPSRQRAPTVGSRRPRIEGVRLFRTRDGPLVLIGKSGKDNHRLTFKLASPEDFWLHAHGVAGAHVVLRNEKREPRPSREALMEAAGAAAWYSGARKERLVEVLWTRRKYVRQVRGAAPGTVSVKKFETVDVEPRLPEGLDERS